MSSVETEPEDFLVYYISEKHVDSALADRLRALQTYERRGLCYFLEVLNPSANTLRGYLNILDELPALMAPVAEECDNGDNGDNGDDVELSGCAGVGSHNVSNVGVSNVGVSNVGVSNIGAVATEKCFWDSPAVLAILDQEGWSRKEKQKKIWEFLEKLRYPLKNRILAELEGSVRTLIKRYGVGLSLPDELEGDDVQFSFSVRSPVELKEVSAALERLAADRDFAVLFEVLKGEEGV